MPTLAQRIAALDWPALHADLDARGFARTGPVLTAAECRALAGLYDTAEFRSTIDMARYRFGEGQHRYFAHPPPPAGHHRRRALSPPLAQAANRWAALLGDEARYP